MKSELIEMLQAAYALALGEVKTAQTAAEGIGRVLCEAHAFVATAEPKEVQTTRPAPVKPDVDPVVAGAQRADRKVKRMAKKAAIAAQTERERAARAVVSAGPAGTQLRAAGVVMPSHTDKVCPHCGVRYIAKRKDQTNCLKDKCRKAALNAWNTKRSGKPASKAPAAANKAPAAATAPVNRVDLIKAAAARVDGMPQSVLDAAAEAASSGEAR